MAHKVSQDNVSKNLLKITQNFDLNRSVTQANSRFDLKIENFYSKATEEQPENRLSFAFDELFLLKIDRFTIYVFIIPKFSLKK